MNARHLFAPALLTLLAGVAQAQPAALRTEKVLPLALANEIAAETVAACAAKGFAVTAAVVDRAGQLRALHRADGAGPHTLASAQKKAFTAASFRAPTSGLQKNVQENPAAAQLVYIDGIIALAGGVPVRGGGEVLGGVGVGGAPGGAIDEQCATDALGKFKDRLGA
jgi:uncharacterized protein GlcG (DUF336 family)